MGKKFSKHLVESISFPAKLIILLWVVHLFQFLTGLSLGAWGVYPREVFGLRGVILSPLIHADWGHLLSNTPPLFVLTFMIMFFYRRVAVPSFIMIYLLTGLTVWAFARDQVFHIGASGVVYGLVAFVFWNGIFRWNIKSIALALVVAFYYGGMMIGVLPGQEGISWESHLFGAIVGILTSFWYKKTIEKDEEKKVYSWEQEQVEEPKHFFEQDLFERTKEERQKEKEQQNWLSDWNSDRTW